MMSSMNSVEKKALAMLFLPICSAAGTQQSEFVWCELSWAHAVKAGHECQEEQLLY